MEGILWWLPNGNEIQHQDVILVPEGTIEQIESMEFQPAVEVIEEESGGSTVADPFMDIKKSQGIDMNKMLMYAAVVVVLIIILKK